MAKSDGTLTYEVANRGNTVAPRVLWNGSGDYSSASGADSVLAVGLNQGHVFVWSGWQGDIPSTLTFTGNGSIAAQLPVAKHADGSAITGTVVDEVSCEHDQVRLLFHYHRHASCNGFKVVKASRMDIRDLNYF